jgi:hypothetical protein
MNKITTTRITTIAPTPMYIFDSFRFYGALLPGLDAAWTIHPVRLKRS